MSMPSRVRDRGALPAGAQSGLTLVELIVAMVIIAVGVAGILLAFDVATRASADPLMPKQALAVAEALLEEVQLAPFTYCDPDDPAAQTANGPGECAVPEAAGPETGDGRPFDNVSDYHGLVLNPISDVSGVPTAGLAGYSAAITVTPAALHTIAALSGDAVRITVAVTAPDGNVYTLEGYRSRYAPKALP
jgi:MSHA pilin protein MshD